MALAPEKIVELKQFIHSHLNKDDINEKLKNLLTETLKEVPNADDPAVANQIRQILQENGIIDNVMGELQDYLRETLPSSKKPLQKILDSNKLKASKSYYIYLQILQGRAFLEHLSEESPLPGQLSSYYKLYIHFSGQRFSSHLTQCACEPDFNEGFLLELPYQSQTNIGTLKEASTLTDLLLLAYPIHLVLVKIDHMNFTSLVASYFLEWRSLLTSSDYRMKLAVELYGVGPQNQIPVGILEMQLELLPSLSECLETDAVTAQMNLERTRKAEQERLFLVYAKNWWKEFLQIRSNHEHRFVKIFAQDENGSTHPVCQYVTPLKVGRLLETPCEAAWFVSLIPYEPAAIIGGTVQGTKIERWANIHTFLCLNKGDCEEHAVLLCSLLLGFGLNAYVCIGSKKNGDPYAWVATLGLNDKVTFWDPLTADRYVHEYLQVNDPLSSRKPKAKHSFFKLGCVFNHCSFYANSQPSDSVFTCQFNLENSSLWKPMSADSLQAVCLYSKWISVRPPPLIINQLDPLLSSSDLEHELCALIIEYRRDIGLTTSWDDNLSHLLGSALASYELERKTGLILNHDDFQQAIRHAVPTGYTFKGFPIRFSHNHARRIFTSSLRAVMFQDILECRGDFVRHAINVRIYTYPESVMSSWIMLAVNYKSVL